jgi:acetoacetyl-CoA reductase/3-oxoacyl-[acyl-carrier protein] reductase
MKTIFDFAGETAIVTGAAAGIGRAIAHALRAAGARVHGVDVNAPDDLEAADEDITWHTVDLRETSDVEALVGRVLETDGAIHHLVNNAGITRDRALWKLEDADWNAVLDVNLSGAFRMLRAVARPMRAAAGGSVVQIASINGLRGKFGQSNYSASKAGIIALTRTAARELGPKGIRVNAIAPGMIETAMTKDLPPAIRDKAIAETCLARLAGPEVVADTVLFLLSSASRHITGTVLPVDGGQLV